MGGVGGADFSDVPLSLSLAVISSPETYLAAENILNRRQLEKNAVTRRHNRTPTHTLSGFVLREQNTQAHTHTHSLIMYNMWTLIHREHQSQFQVRHAALRILGILLRGFTCGGIWITASCLCEHHCALLTRFGSTVPDLFCQERSQNSVFCAVDGTFLSGLFWDPVTRGAWKVKLHVHAYWLTFFCLFYSYVLWAEQNLILQQWLVLFAFFFFFFVLTAI